MGREVLQWAGDQKEGTTIVTCLKYAWPDRDECRIEEPSVNMVCK